MEAAITIGYNGDLERLARSLPQDVYLVVFIHSNNYPDNLLDWYENKTIFWYKQNRGISKSWNEGLEHCFEKGFETAIIMNDDIYFVIPEEFTKLANAGKEWPLVASSHHYSCFSMRRDCYYELIGAFDENIVPAYYEDVEYQIRLNLAGISKYLLDTPGIYHEGSGTIHKDKVLKVQNVVTMLKIQDYMRSKWNSIDGENTYKHPFNTPGLSYFLDPVTKLHLPIQNLDESKTKTHI